MSLYAIVGEDDRLLMIGTHMEETFVNLAAIFETEQQATNLLALMQLSSPAMRKCRVADVKTLAKLEGKQ